MTISITRGDTKIIPLRISADGGHLTLKEGDTARFTAKNSAGQAVIKKTVTMANQASDGYIFFEISPCDTEKLEINGCLILIFDIELTLANGFTRTFFNGETLMIIEDITTPSDKHRPDCEDFI